MLGIFENKIDTLTKRKSKLELKKLKVQDRQNEVNSSIETKLKKFENLAWRNKENAKTTIEEIDREISKINQLIEVEKEYVIRINKSNKDK